MKTWLVGILFLATLMCLASFGADSNAPVAIKTEVTDVLKIPWVQSLIVIAVPMIIAGLKAVWPKVPSVLLPFLAPVLGLAIDYVSGLAGLDVGNPATSAALGAAGVWLREAYDQSRKAIAEKKVPTPTP